MDKEKVKNLHLQIKQVFFLFYNIRMHNSQINYELPSKVADTKRVRE